MASAFSDGCRPVTATIDVSVPGVAVSKVTIWFAVVSANAVAASTRDTVARTASAASATARQWTRARTETGGFVGMDSPTSFSGARMGPGLPYRLIIQKL